MRAEKEIHLCEYAFYTNTSQPRNTRVWGSTQSPQEDERGAWWHPAGLAAVYSPGDLQQMNMGQKNNLCPDALRVQIPPQDTHSTPRKYRNKLGLFEWPVEVPLHQAPTTQLQAFRKDKTQVMAKVISAGLLPSSKGGGRQNKLTGGEQITWKK